MKTLIVIVIVLCTKLSLGQNGYYKINSDTVIIYFNSGGNIWKEETKYAQKTNLKLYFKPHNNELAITYDTDFSFFSYYCKYCDYNGETNTYILANNVTWIYTPKDEEVVYYFSENGVDKIKCFKVLSVSFIK